MAENNVSSIKFNSKDLYENPNLQLQQPTTEETDTSIFDHVNQNLEWVGDKVDDGMNAQDAIDFLTHIDTNSDGEFTLEEAEQWLTANEEAGNNHKEKFGDAKNVLQLISNFATSFLGVEQETVNKDKPKPALTLHDYSADNVNVSDDWKKFVDGEIDSQTNVGLNRCEVIYSNGTKIVFNNDSGLPEAIFPQQPDEQVYDERIWSTLLNNGKVENCSDEFDFRVVTYKDGTIIRYPVLESGQYSSTPYSIEFPNNLT